jgi:hypothetical protein
MIQLLFRLCISLATTSLLFLQAAHAGEQGHYTPNSWSPRDLLSAPPGLKAVALYLSFYDADTAKTGQGDRVDASTGVDVGANSWMATPVIVYAPPTKLLGADWMAVLVPAFGESGANARLTAYEQNIPLFDNNNLGFADLYAIPLNLTWHLSSMWAVSAQYAFWAPIGEYSPSRSDNVGLGYWSHDVRGTVSFFPMENPSLLISASILNEANGRKQGYDLRPAPHTVVELGISQAFSERFIFGVLTGGIWETGDASGNDAAEDGRDRMINASLEASYWFIPGKLGAMARATQELHARDRFQGTTYTVGLNIPL